MFLKNIFKITASFLLLITPFSTPYAASRIMGGEFISLEAKLVLLADVNNNKKLIPIDLRSCSSFESISIPEDIRTFAVSEYISAYALLGGKGLFVYNLQDGKLVKSFDDFIRSVYVISQSDMGEFVAASDGLTVALYQFKKEGLTKLFSKEFSGGVSALYPDTETNSLFVFERNGKISVWSFAGKLQKNLSVDFSISSIIYDEKTGKFLAVSPKGLYYISKDDAVSEKLLNGKILSAFIETYSSRLQVMTDYGFKVYDYPVMREVLSLDGANGTIIKSDGANFAAFSGLNYIRIYDLTKNIHIGTMAVDSLGVVNFFSPDTQYGTNISASFIAAAANSTVEKPEYNKDRVCAPIAAMVAGVYAPNNLNIDKVEMDNVAEVHIQGVKEVAEPKQVNIPQISFSGGNLSVPDVKPVANTPDVKFAEHNPNIKDPDEASNPNEPKVKDIEDLMASKIPNWVANRKNLPKNNSVGNGSTEQDALLNAKLSLKNNMVRTALESIVKAESLSSVTDINSKKRILWQAAAKAVNSLDSKILTVDSWVSPVGQNYIHLIMNDESLKSQAKIYLAEELKKFHSMDEKAYMAEKPEAF